jgi:hypothetical protein
MGREAGNLCQWLISRRAKSNCWRFRCTNTNLVAETLGGDDGNFIANALIGLEVKGELWVVTPVSCV